MEYTPPEWTLDCQGKQDMDGPIVELSTRFYPETYQRNRRCSTIASIYIGDERVAEAEFEADSETEVKRLTEEWALATGRRIAAVVKAMLSS